MAKSADLRPPVAVGHVHIPVRDVAATNDFLQRLGLRPVFQSDMIAVLELRGGTHLIVEKSRKRIKAGAQAPVDFMVDDVQKARTQYAKMGLKPTRIKTGRIHSSFFVPGPDGWSYKITSSHATDQPV